MLSSVRIAPKLYRKSPTLRVIWYSGKSCQIKIYITFIEYYIIGDFIKYDIVPIRSHYRGIERSLTTLNFKGNRKIGILLQKYFEYILLIEKPFSTKNLESLVNYLCFFNQIIFVVKLYYMTILLLKKLMNTKNLFWELTLHVICVNH